MSATAITFVRRPAGRRLAYAVLALAMLVAVVLKAIEHGAGWQIAAGGLGPDLALFVGIGSGLEKGQLHPRAVWLYNLLHRYWLPVALAVAAAFGLVSFAVLLGALAWAFHISLDRALGYGLRTRDGFQSS